MVVCKDWHDWETKPEEHAPFHFWKRMDVDSRTIKTRLGQRMYTTSCLLWSSMHDRVMANKLADQCPNWSTVCSYYSMVHALRLAWFVLYGGYPTGHSSMGNVLADRTYDYNRKEYIDGGQANANWHHGDLESGRAQITHSALVGAIEQGLVKRDLAEQLESIGRVFQSAVDLRNDANYESLLLAHQYHHWSGRPGGHHVNVSKAFQTAQKLMKKSNDLVLSYVAELLMAAFADEREWFCRNHWYSGDVLWGAVINAVNQMIQGCLPYFTDMDVHSWWNSSPFGPLRNASSFINPDYELDRGSNYELFGVKRSIMEEFRNEKIEELRKALEHARQMSPPWTITESSKDENCFRGSRKHILNWVEQEGFLSTLNSLLMSTGAVVGPNDWWKPKGFASHEESVLVNESDLRIAGLLDWKEIVDWWLVHCKHESPKIPNWDLACTCSIEGSPGLILVEAKANENELDRKAKRPPSKTRESIENHDRIGYAIEEARASLEELLKEPCTISRDLHYQLSNRVAYAWKIARMGVPVVLMYIGFTGDTYFKDHLRDNSHWRRIFDGYIQGVLPQSMLETKMNCGKASMTMIVRTKPVLAISS